jgi:hypothetical protein
MERQDEAALTSTQPPATPASCMHDRYAIEF